jgi:histidinol dehydrogenase
MRTQQREQMQTQQREQMQTQQRERMQTQQREQMQTQQREQMQTQQRERMELAVTHILQRADTDGDGMLSMYEARPPQDDQMFEYFDTDGNGEVTQEEWDAAITRSGNRNT